ncbi:MAG: hypothetical protein QOH90_658 [Actinomycetota bacterium]|jgi:hypothetical protein|nr:hypothetical protein [Actinomycetota bacterium]
MELMSTLLGQLFQAAVFLSAATTLTLFAVATVGLRAIERRRQP